MNRLNRKKVSITLIEAVTVITIFAVIAVTAGSILFTTGRSGAKLSDEIETSRNANWAIEYMVNEARWGVNFTVSPAPFANFDLVTFESDIDHDGIDAADLCADNPYVWYWRGFTTTAIPITAYGDNTTLYRGVDNTCNVDFETSFQVANTTRQELTTFLVDNPVDPDNSPNLLEMFKYCIGRQQFMTILTTQSSPSDNSQVLRAQTTALNDVIDFSQGLVADYPFEGDANDLSGSLNHGTEGGDIAYITGQIGQAKIFDGTGDYVSVADSSALRISHYTVSIWIRPNGVPSEVWKGIVGKPGRNYNIWLHNSGLIHHRFHNAASTNAGVPNTPAGSIAWNEWNHVVITNDGTTARTYINGVERASGSSGGDQIIDNTMLYVGRSLDGGAGNYFNGQIDDLKIWDWGLGPLEVRALYEQGAGCD
ncbi:MAG: LamG domain-containing protein [Candidatus Omnitrophica bacterium]|nr:LamG domain-containing protein [Candidatus Omnitrophota bacterium]